MQRSKLMLDVSLISLSILLFETDLSLNPELTILPGLPGPLGPAYLPCWDCSLALPHLAFSWVLGI